MRDHGQKSEADRHSKQSRRPREIGRVEKERGRARGFLLSYLRIALYCIVLYLQPVLNPKSYDGARVLEASGRPMLVIGRSYVFVSIQVGEMIGGTKLSEEMTE